jgi:hypothetical protein
VAPRGHQRTSFGTYGLPDSVRIGALGPAALVGAAIGGSIGLSPVLSQPAGGGPDTVG